LRPLAVLLAIILGSAVAIAVSLTMTGVVFLFLGEYAARLAPERLPLLKGLAGAWLLSLLAATALYGELRARHWRRLPQLLLLLVLAGLGWRYWP